MLQFVPNFRANFPESNSMDFKSSRKSEKLRWSSPQGQQGESRVSTTQIPLNNLFTIRSILSVTFSIKVSHNTKWGHPAGNYRVLTAFSTFIVPKWNGMWYLVRPPGIEYVIFRSHWCYSPMLLHMADIIFIIIADALVPRRQPSTRLRLVFSFWIGKEPIKIYE